MSVYKRPGADTFSYDFKVARRRFSGSTGATTRREAERAEAREREVAKAELRRERGTIREPMTFEAAAGRYWHEVGQHHAGGGDENTLWSLAWLKRNIGPHRRIADIDDAVVAGIVAIRRGEPVRSGQNRKAKSRTKHPAKPPRLVSPATVNRSVTEPLRKILNRAKRTWKETVADIAWRDHMLREPRERVREMRTEEEARIFAALRADYHPVVRFAILTGLRLGEIPRLAWQDVDWGGRQITVYGKGGKVATIPLAPDVRALLWSLRGHHPEAVFTYVAAKTYVAVETRPARKRGERYPITRSGLQTTFRRVLPDADVLNYSFHDNRHTTATRVLRATGNLKIVQRLLRHDQITTTTKYAHALDDDVMAAMQLAADRASAAQEAHRASSPTENPTGEASEPKKAVS